MTFTEAQGRAVREDARILACIAGAGAGKTKVLTHRIVRLLDEGVSPRDILALTFTRAAATEMRERLEALVDPRRIEGLQILTIHAWAHSLLRRHPQAVGRSHDFTVYDETDVEDVQKGILADLNIAETTWRGATTTKAKDPKKIAARQKQAEQLYAELDRRLRAWDALTFDALIRGAIKALEDEKVRAEVHVRHVLVDEMQDTAPDLWRVCEAMTPDVLFAVGDFRQAIYGWLGAVGDAPPDAETIILAENFRSTPEIVGAANTIATQMGDLPPMIATRDAGGPVEYAESADREARGASVAEVVGDAAVILGARNVAVLAREWRSLEPVAQALAARGVPTWMPGRVVDVWSTPGARMLFAVLRAAVNPRDGLAEEQIAAERWGRERMLAVRAATKRAGLRLLDGDTETARALAAVAEARGDVVVAAELVDVGLHLALMYASTGRDTKAAEIRATIDAIRDWRAERHGRTVVELVDWLTHRQLAERVREGGDAVVLSTIHGAKGLEWPVVVLLDWRPHGDEAEERRVWYVGATRARDELHVAWYGEPSPFLAGLLGEHGRSPDTTLAEPTLLDLEAADLYERGEQGVA